MELYQQRVVTEQGELNEKISLLSSFINGPVFPTIEYAEQERLVSQRRVMRQYFEILGERISSFK